MSWPERRTAGYLVSIAAIDKKNEKLGHKSSTTNGQLPGTSAAKDAPHFIARSFARENKNKKIALRPSTAGVPAGAASQWHAT